MDLVSLEFSFLALIPALALAIFVYRKDSLEKEPLWLLTALFFLGGALTIPTVLIRKGILTGLDALFSSSFRFTAEGYALYDSFGAEFAHKALCAFFGYALVQVLLQWLVLFLATRRNPHFNYLFDGVVYSVFLSLGFSAAESVFFAAQNGFETLAVRLVSSLSCQLFLSILMGYCFSMWSIRFSANRIEDRLLRDGKIRRDRIPSSAKWYLFGSLAPMLLGGLYQLAASVPLRWVEFLLYFTLFLFYGLSFAAVDQLAAKDGPSKRYLFRLILKAHPDLTEEEIEAAGRGWEGGEA